VALIIYILLYPEGVRASVTESMRKVLFSVLPPLFCFIFAGDILAQTPFIRLFYLRPLRKAARGLGLSPSGMLVFFSGLLFGFPSGAAITARLVNDNRIDKSEAQRLIAFSNNPSPAFFVAVVGRGIMKSAYLGWILYFSSVTTSIFIAYAFGKGEKCKGEKSIDTAQYNSIGEILSSSAYKAIFASLNICAYTVIFGAVCDMIFSVCEGFLPPFLRGMISGVFEITRGVFESAAIDNSLLMLVSLCFALGFSGLSVAMQISSLVEKSEISMKKYFFYRIIYVFAYILASIFFIIFR